MTKEEKAEYKNETAGKRAGRSEATECCYGNGKDSQKDVGRRRDQHSDELLGHLVSDNAEDTKTAVESFSSCTKQLSRQQ